MWNQYWGLPVWILGMVMSVQMMEGDWVFSQEETESEPTTGEPFIHERQERISIDNAGTTFPFQQIPTPVKDDLATKAEFTLVSGRVDANSGGLSVLHDDRLPKSSDSPAENFFFNAGEDGGRFVVDLGEVHALRQVNTYSWHPGSRGPQVYTLYASDGSNENFNAKPLADTDPTTCGWQLLTQVDTRKPAERRGGGQYGVSISAQQGALGNFRYLLFAVSQTQADDRFSNTFFSEIDVLGMTTEAVAITEPAVAAVPVVYEIEDGKYRFSLDVSQAPDLEPWTREQLVPVIQTWYPKIIALLPTEGFDPPKQFSIVFHADMEGVAHVQGTRMSCAVNWFRRNLEGEAKGAVVHELVHIVQQYGQARRNNRRAASTPGWVVEGVADYVRWFLYEPESGGANISRRNLARARYDGNYRITANFLDWVVREVQPEMVAILNTAARRGQYSTDLWIEHTGTSLEQLDARWKEYLTENIGE